VERTLGFSTRYLDDRDIRLVQVTYCTCWIKDYIYTFVFIKGIHYKIEQSFCTYWSCVAVDWFYFNLFQKDVLSGLLGNLKYLSTSTTTTKPCSLATIYPFDIWWTYS
jgi:hypothetical protein